MEDNQVSLSMSKTNLRNAAPSASHTTRTLYMLFWSSFWALPSQLPRHHDNWCTFLSGFWQANLLLVVRRRMSTYTANVSRSNTTQGKKSKISGESLHNSSTGAKYPMKWANISSSRFPQWKKNFQRMPEKALNSQDKSCSSGKAAKAPLLALWCYMGALKLSASEVHSYWNLSGGRETWELCFPMPECC